MKVLVCDDKKEQCDQAVAIIQQLGVQEDLTASGRHSDELTKILKSFFGGIRETEGQSPVQSIFDDYAIVFLDNNLSALVVEGARLTAEAIAGYIRAYSKATYIVSLNKNPEVDFDLRYLVGDYSTVANLALNTDHLANKALWTGDPDDADKDDAGKAFKPWYWPSLLDEPTRRRDQIDFVRMSLDKPVFEALGFPDELARYISRHATGTLSPDALYPTAVAEDSANAASLSEITFVQFFNSRSRSLPSKEERQLIESDLDMVSHVVAADIDLWFRRDLLAPQDALVDLPHLLLRMPFLLGERAGELTAWNETISMREPRDALEQSVYDAYLSNARLAHSMWAPQPAFFWSQLRNVRHREGATGEAAMSTADVVFCEDVSRFVYRKPADEDSPVQFEAECEGSWSRRYVARVAGKGYIPRSRFAL